MTFDPLVTYRFTLPPPPKMLRSAEMPSQKLKPKERRRRPTLQRARDYVRDVARIDLSSDAAKSKSTTEQDRHQPDEVRSDKGRQTDSRHSRGSIPKIQIQERSASSTPTVGSFTHLRRNAVSDGIPYGDYRYLTGGRSEYEYLQDGDRQKGNHFQYAGQERLAQSRNVSTETVWKGGGAAEDVIEEAGVSSSVDSDLRKVKERQSSDLEERGVMQHG